MNLTPKQLEAIVAFQDAAHERTRTRQEFDAAEKQVEVLGKMVGAAQNRYEAAQKAMRDALIEE